MTEWYQGKKNMRDYLTLSEIADACGCSVSRVKKWFLGQIVTAESSTENMVNAGDVITFLLNNSLPFYPALLPTNSKKMLCILPHNFSQLHVEEVIDRIIDVLTFNFSLLIDRSRLGRFAELALLTFSPDIILIITETCSDDLCTMIDLTTRFPEKRIILVSDDITHLETAIGDAPHAPLLLGTKLPRRLLKEKLESYLFLGSEPWKEKKTTIKP